MEKLIIDPQADSGEGLKKHTKGPGTRYVFSDHNNNPEGNIFVSTRKVENLDKPEEYTEPHTHDDESLFIFKGSHPDMSGLKAEFLLGNQWYKIESPKAIRIPPGLKHSHRLIQGSGEYWNIVLAPGGDYNKTVG